MKSALLALIVTPHKPSIFKRNPDAAISRLASLQGREGGCQIVIQFRRTGDVQRLSQGYDVSAGDNLGACDFVRFVDDAGGGAALWRKTKNESGPENAFFIRFRDVIVVS